MIPLIWADTSGRLWVVSYCVHMEKYRAKVSLHAPRWPLCGKWKPGRKSEWLMGCKLCARKCGVTFGSWVSWWHLIVACPISLSKATIPFSWASSTWSAEAGLNDMIPNISTVHSSSAKSMCELLLAHRRFLCTDNWHRKPRVNSHILSCRLRLRVASPDPELFRDAEPHSWTKNTHVASIQGCEHFPAYLLPGVSSIPHTAKPEGRAWEHTAGILWRCT